MKPRIILIICALCFVFVFNAYSTHCSIPLEITSTSVVSQAISLDTEVLSDDNIIIKFLPNHRNLLIEESSVDVPARQYDLRDSHTNLAKSLLYPQILKSHITLTPLTASEEFLNIKTEGVSIYDRQTIITRLASNVPIITGDIIKKTKLIAFNSNHATYAPPIDTKIHEGNRLVGVQAILIHSISSIHTHHLESHARHSPLSINDKELLLKINNTDIGIIRSLADTPFTIEDIFDC